MSIIDSIGTLFEGGLFSRAIERDETAAVALGKASASSFATR